MSFPLLGRNEICVSILSLQIEFGSTRLGSKGQMGELPVRSGSKLFSLAEVKTIEKELESRDIADCIVSHGFAFPWDPHELQNVLQLRNEKPEFVSVYSLLSFLSWYVRVKSMADVEIVTDTLVMLISDPAFAKLHVVESVATSALVMIVKELLQDNDFDGDILINSFAHYLSKARVLHDEVLGLSVKVMQRRVKYQPEIVGNACVLTDVLIHLIQFKSHMIPKSFVTAMLGVYSNAIAHLDSNALQFFQAATDVLDKQEVSVFFEPMLTYLVMLVDKQCVKEFVSDGESQVIKLELRREDAEVEAPVNYNMMEPYEDICLVPPVLKMETLIDEKVYVSMTLLVGLLLKQNGLMEIFLEATGELEIQPSPFIMDQYAVLFFVYECALEFKLLTKPPPKHILMNERFWNPSVTVFDKGQNFEYISSFRQTVVRSLPLQPPGRLAKFLISLSSWPLLYAETVLRMRALCSSLLNDGDKVSALTKGLLIPMMQYRQYWDNIAAKKARCAIFMLLKDLLQLPETRCLLLSDSEFANLYVLLLLEPPLRQAVLSTISDYLHSVKSNVSAVPVFEALSKMLGLDSCQHDEDWDTLLMELIGVMNEVAISNSHVALHMKTFASTLCRISITREAVRESKDMLIALISVLTATGSSFTIKSGDIFTIEEAVSAKIDQSTKDETISVITRVIFGGDIPNQQVCEIKQPKVIPSFLRIFLKANYIRDATNIVMKLCSVRSNCIQCHESNVDMYLIDEVQTFCQTGDVDEEVVDEYLKIFIEISNVVSSVQVVRRFVSLLCLVNGKHLSKYHSNVLRAFSECFLRARNNPSDSLPLAAGNEIELKGIASECIKSGFCFSFWALLSRPICDYQRPLFTLIDKENPGSRIGFEIYGRNIRIHTNEDHVYQVCADCFNLPVNSWTLVSISYVQNPESHDVAVKVYLNGHLEQTASISGPFKMRNELLGFINSQGTKLKEAFDDNECCLFLGPVMLFSECTKEELVSLYDYGPRLPVFEQMEPIFAFEPLRSNGTFRFQSLCLTSQVTATCSNLRMKHGTSLFDLFLDFCKISMILPIFAQVDCPNAEGRLIPGLSSLAIEIIERLFQLGEKTQVLFSECTGFHIIAHLLLRWDDTHITFELYSRLARVLDVISYEKLKVEMLEQVMTNVEIWKKSGQHDIFRILQHWLGVLYPSLKMLFVNSVTLQWILFVLHHYFPYHDQADDPGEWLSQTRQMLFEIALTVSRQMLSPSDVYCIIGYLMKDNNDWRAKVELLRFLASALSRAAGNTDVTSYLSRCVEFLKSLLESQFDIVIVETIECISNIYNIYNANVPMAMRGSASQQILKIMRCVQYHTFTSWAFDSLVGTLNRGVPELFPLLCMIAINMGEDVILKLITSASRGQNYYFDETSVIWPTVMLYSVSKEHRIEVADFLVSRFATKWEDLYSAVCLYGRTQPIDDFEDIQSLVLLIMAKRPRLKDEVARFLLRCMKQVLFYRLPETQNQALISAWERSPFNPANNWESKAPGSEPDIYENVEFTEVFRIKGLPSYRCCRRQKKGKRKQDPGTKEEEPTFRYSDDAVSFLVNDGIVTTSLQGDHSLPLKSLFGPDALAEKIRESLETRRVYDFGLRLGPYGGWKDAELAKAAVTLFKKNKCGQFCDLIGIVLFFLQRSECDCFEKEETLIDWLKEHTINEHHMFLENRDHRNTISFFERFASFPDMELSNSISRLASSMLAAFQAQISLKEEDMSKILEQIDKVIQAREASVFDLADRNSKKWARLWRSLTISRAPWHGSLPVNDVNYKRDPCFGFAFCPMRLKPDMHQRDYLRASLLRDICNQELTDLAIAELRSQGEREAPALLLFKVSEIKDREDEAPVAQKKSSLDCIIQTISDEIPAKLMISKNGLTIFARKHAAVIKASEILHMLYRTKHHRWKGFEIFTKRGTSTLLYFEGEKFRTIPMVMRGIPSLPTNALQQRMFPFFFESLGLTKKWCDREISNFEYLIALNIFSGRSFNDLTVYPYFPWVITDYESQTLDLANPSVFRDLSKPIGALNPERLEELLNRDPDSAILGRDQFIYSCCPSNPLSVCLYLIRLAPFTSQHISIQGGKFDHATRLFNSIQQTYRLVTSIAKDYRELIPEFFFLPDMFLNNNKLDLGKTNDGVVNDVEMPPWAANTFDFIYKHRKALESDYVSQHLHHWIDMTWGYQQRGPEAWKANNVFPQEAYEDVWLNPKFKEDATLKRTTELIQDTSGQIPAQLFTKPHPVRQANKRSQLIQTPFQLLLDSKHVIASQSETDFQWQVLDQQGLKHASVSLADIRKAIHLGRQTLEITARQNSQLPRVDMFAADIVDRQSFVFYEDDSSTINIVNSENITTHSFPIEIDCLESSHDGWFLVACRDAQMSIFEGTTMKGSISTFRDSITCAALAPSQDAIVCGTRDQSLLVCSLRHCTVYRDIDLPGKPRHIVITKAFSLVAVVMSHVDTVNHLLALYTINGMKVSETPLKSKITTISTFVDASSFDHLILADTAGDVYTFEAYPVSIPRPIMRAPPPIISLSVHSSTLSAVSQNGTITLISL